MHIHIVKNKYLNALLLLMLFSAIVHTAVLLFVFIKSGNWHLFNYFSILNFDYIIPGISSAPWSDILSFIIMAGIFGFILKNNK